MKGTLLAIAAVLVALPFTYLRMRGTARRDLALTALGALAIVVALAALLAFTPVGGNMQTVMQDPGTQLRLRLIDSAGRAFFDRPLLGYGPDNFAAAYPRYRQPGGVTSGTLEIDTHSWPFQTAATTGALGLLALIAPILFRGGFR